MGKKNLGFTLIEVLIVLSIIAILLTLAMPSSNNRIMRIRVAESMELIDIYKPNIEQFYYANNTFPLDNKTAGIPEPSKIIGNYITGVIVDQGALHIVLGNKIFSNLVGKRVTIRPIYVDDSPNSPVSWICGYDEAPQEMVAAGPNHTDLKLEFLPLKCR
jgi:type IV pilus assembly protein PilA